MLGITDKPANPSLITVVNGMHERRDAQVREAHDTGGSTTTMVLETTPHRKIAVTIQADIQPSTTTLTAFRQKCLEWIGPLESAGPVYRIPRRAIQGLQEPPAGHRSIMSDEEAEAETAFSDLCQNNKAVGVWHGSFVCPSYLIRPDSPSENMLRGFNWTKRQVQATLALVGKTDSIAARLLSLR